jgi:hypothetical protein
LICLSSASASKMALKTLVGNSKYFFNFYYIYPYITTMLG